MPPNVGAGYIDIVPNIATGWQRSINTDVDRVTKGIAGKFSSTFKSIALGAGAMFAGQQVFDFLGDSVGQGRESIKITKLTEAAIKSTGGVANVTADQVANLATNLSQLTGIDDELIQSGENLLLTFTNVRNEAGKGNDIFDQATGAALDLSARGFGTVESASVMLGKALNDPIRGLTALGRAGVTFTDDQKEQIRTLAENNDLLGAQGIILAEVNKQVGGSAEAAATPMDRLKVTVGNLQEEIGIFLIPMLDQAAGWLADRLPGAMAAFKAWVDETGKPAFATIASAWRDDILPALQGVWAFAQIYVFPLFVTIADWITTNQGTFIGFSVAVGAIALAFLFVSNPILATIALLVGAAAATDYLVDRFGLLPKASSPIQWVVDHVIVPLKETIEAARDALEDVLGLLDRIPVGGPGGGGIFGGIGLGGLGGLALGGSPLGPLLGALGIRGYADGGTVPGPIGSPQFAIVHGGERIAPPGRSLNDDDLAGGSGQTFVQNIYNPAPESAGDSARKLRRVALEVA